jgi:hypothetical protein
LVPDAAMSGRRNTNSAGVCLMEMESLKNGGEAG